MTTSSRVPVRPAGVPGVLRTPPGDGPAPLVLCWHGFGPPASADAMADAMPFSGLEAWRAYFDLPFFGRRLPEGGPRELARRQTSDYVGELLGPAVRQAVDELPDLLSALQERLGGLWDRRVGLAGSSVGGVAALLALAEGVATADAAVTVGTPKDARTPVEVLERTAGVDVEWTPEAESVARTLDFVARAGELAAAAPPPPALLLLHDAGDELVPLADARELHRALSGAYADRGHDGRVALEVVSGSGHGPGDVEGAVVGAASPGREGSGTVESLAVAWLDRWIGSDGSSDR